VSARRGRSSAAGVALVALALAGGGACERMIIGHLPAPADAAADVSRDPAPGSSDARDTGPGSSDALAGDGADRPSDGPGDRSAGDDVATAGDGAVTDARAGGDRAAADAAPPDAAMADAASDAVVDAGPPAIGVIAGRITMSDTATFTSRGSGVAGVLVTLTGPSARTAISDANGAFQFPSIAPGNYTVAVSKDGATFTPPSASGVGVNAGSAGTVVNFDCAPPCGTGPAVDRARELFINDPSVLTDARTANGGDGAWSFRYLIEQMATRAPNNYVDDFISNIAASGRDMTRLRSQWPTTVDTNNVVLPDITRAPFELLAIVNGIDAHASGQGELRFVYGIYDVPGAPQFSTGLSRTFTLMLTYALPATAALPSRQAWAQRFHALGAIPFGAGYNAALQSITDAVVRTGTLPSTAENPRGSALVAMSINEGFGNSPFQLRQLRPLPDPVHAQRELVVSAVEQTPDTSLNTMNGALPDFLNANAALVQGGFAPLPVTLLGMQSSVASLWTFPSVTSEPLRHAFAGQTCAGCHSTEVPAGAGFTVFHVIPFDGPNSPSTSGWVTIVDLPRRVSFLQNQLTCSGATCATGAEPMMGPTR
jgi:hypothetical protein